MTKRNLKNLFSISRLRFIAVLIFITAIPVFFWAWGEYYQHSKIYLKDSSYNMPWDVLYLNLYWIGQLSLAFVLIHVAKIKDSSKNKIKFSTEE